MKERQIQHPLRTIVMRYAEEKPETDYEKKLMQEYVALHDRMHQLHQDVARMLYKFDEHDERVSEAEKKFAPIAKVIKSFHDEAVVMTKKVKNKEAVDDIIKRLGDYVQHTDDFHQNILTPVADEAQEIQKEYEAFLELKKAMDQAFKKFDNETKKDLYKNYSAYGLDLNAFDADFDNFRGCFKKIREFNDRREVVLDHYERLIAEVTRAYAEWDNVKKLASEFYDDKNVLDSSLSDSYAAGTGDKKLKPKYLIPPGDPRIKDFKINYGPLANSQNHTLHIKIPMDIVLSGDTAMIQELVMTLQHFPLMMEKLLFSIELDFMNREGQVMTADEWKGHEKPMRWIQTFSTLPCVLFFLQDHDARAYFLMGDLVLDKRLKTTDDGAVLLEGEGFQEFAQRLFHSCYFMLLFCYNTGFDPTPYIESILADYGIGLDFQQVKKKFDEDIKKGIEVKAVPVKGGKRGDEKL